MPHRFLWEWHFKSEPANVREALNDILRYLDEHLPSQTPEDRWDFKLIFNELLFNAVIHGNASDVSKSIHVHAEIRGGFIRASVMDEGGGYDFNQVLKEIKRTSDDLQKESGRGIRLVAALTDEIKFSHEGRCVTFTRRVGRMNG